MPSRSWPRRRGRAASIFTKSTTWTRPIPRYRWTDPRYIADGKPDEARVLLEAIDQRWTIIRNRAGAGSMEVASTPVADVSAEKARIAADPDDHEARFAIANAQMASGDRDSAAEELLTIIGRDPTWNDGAAKTRLLQMLEAAGFADPWGRGIRRRLSALLFT